MKSIFTGTVAVVLGMVFGGGVNWLLAVNINTSIWPLPEGITMDPTQADALAEWISTLPGQAFVLVFVAHVLQSGVGAFVAAAVSQVRTPSYIVIVLTALGGLMNFMSLWEVTPRWMLLEFPAYFVVGSLGARFGLKIRGACKTKN